MAKKFLVLVSILSLLFVFGTKTSSAMACEGDSCQLTSPCDGPCPTDTPTPTPCFNSDQVEVPCPTESPVPTPTPCEIFNQDSEFPVPCPTESPTPDPTATPLVCSGDQHANANNTACVSFDQPGGGSSSGGGTTSTGQVLGASTLAATGDGTGSLGLSLMALGLSVSLSSLYVFKKRI